MLGSSPVEVAPRARPPGAAGVGETEQNEGSETGGGVTGVPQDLGTGLQHRWFFCDPDVLLLLLWCCGFILLKTCSPAIML